MIYKPATTAMTGAILDNPFIKLLTLLIKFPGAPISLVMDHPKLLKKSCVP